MRDIITLVVACLAVGLAALVIVATWREKEEYRAACTEGV